MRVSVHRLNLSDPHVSINFRCADRRMTEQLLNHRHPDRCLRHQRCRPNRRGVPGVYEPGARLLVGFYADVSGLHGLLATTIPEPSTPTLLEVGSLSLIYLVCRRWEKALTGGQVAPVFTPVTVRERSLVGDSSIS
jgi:hypothetical protein